MNEYDDLSVRIDKDVKSRARAAAAALRGDAAVAGGVSGIVERLLLREVTRLEKAHNAGDRFPAVDRLPRGPIAKGRPGA